MPAGRSRQALGARQPAPHLARMTRRTALALPIGLLAFLAYVGLVVVLADPVLGLHWAVQALYFVVAGLAWTWPARRLMVWAAGARP